LRNGRYTISAYDGAGIGAGYARYADSIAESIVIENGVYILSVSSAAGIGTANVMRGNSTIGSLVIRGGTFTVTASRAAGIGTGESSDGISNIGQLTIQGGTFQITTTSAAAIGAGIGEQGNSSVTRLTIAAGTFNISGQTGIGSSRQGVTSLLSFQGSASDQVVINCRTQRLFCFSAKNMIGDTVPVNATTNSAMFIEAPLGATTDLSGLNFVGTYLRNTELDTFSNAPILHVGAINDYPPGSYYLTFRSASTQKIIPINTVTARGVAATVPAGVYTVRISGTANGVGEELCARGTTRQFTVGQKETFVGDLGICGDASGSDSGSISGGAIAGISIGVIALIAIIGVALFFFIGGSNLCLGLRARGAAGDSTVPAGYTAASGDI
jgi:hypothetical protein